MRQTPTAGESHISRHKSKAVVNMTASQNIKKKTNQKKGGDDKCHKTKTKYNYQRKQK